jgi:hypothetical protein
MFYDSGTPAVFELYFLSKTKIGMEKAEDISQGLNFIRLPISIAYSVVGTYLRKKMIGETISSEDEDGKVSTYAEILDLSLEKSQDEAYDLALELKFKTLTTFFRNKEGKILLHLSLDFDKEEQLVSVNNFKLEGNTKNWLLNRFLETIGNTFMHGKIKNKMKFDFRPEIEKHLRSMNEKLGNRLEVAEGIFLFGRLNTFKISEIIPQASRFLVLVSFEGNTLLNIEKISSQPQI